MITDADGRYCPDCIFWFNPWAIRRAIAIGDEKVFCPYCRKWVDIDDLREERIE